MACFTPPPLAVFWNIFLSLLRSLLYKPFHLFSLMHVLVCVSPSFVSCNTLLSLLRTLLLVSCLTLISLLTHLKIFHLRLLYLSSLTFPVVINHPLPSPRPSPHLCLSVLTFSMASPPHFSLHLPLTVSPLPFPSLHHSSFPRPCLSLGSLHLPLSPACPCLSSTFVQ